VNAIGAAIRELHGIRALLIPEIRTADDANAARHDANDGRAAGRDR
jgi:hypothetical protein